MVWRETFRENQTWKLTPSCIIMNKCCEFLIKYVQHFNYNPLHAC